MTRVNWLDLQVVDLEKQSRFYQQLLGFEVLQQTDARVELGSQGSKLLGLQSGAKSPADPRQAGLYHAAWLFPRRADLGAWLRHSRELGIRLDGASDHGVSEAFYLNDPEGNGIEIYWDKPREEWPFNAGKLAMVTDPLDLDSLLQAAEGYSWDGFPPGGELGHLHFQSPRVEETAAFFESLGFEPTQDDYPGARFLSMDGYHHHVAVNHWRARNPKSQDSAGLLRYSLTVDKPKAELLDPLGLTCLLG
ncbi:MAG: VOC family protein [Vulcanimicrobiota bacterium]